MKTTTLKNGFYFETSKDLAELTVDGFYFTKYKKNATTDFALLIEKDCAWTGAYSNATIEKTFFQHLEDIKLVDNSTYYIWNKITDESFDTNENRFYSSNWEVVLDEKNYLETLISNNPEKFENCIIVNKFSE
ncbi:hypothetical protein OX284_014310 [Flavobacterium sp. SUN046]|uniref:hypothetical protein n=1 Tax=Flavobacterium sp. SUN046 TaxID=3002440 RepID=UPI002DBD031D|nr:hypothetical protein [Flavobacterium sp. SUN046]MEC4050609.1 hypothetical protein [Flavobacterium sp. SUN046]